MKRVFFAMLAMCIGLTLPARAQMAYVDGKNADRVHLREGAGTDTASLGLFFTGTSVVCLSDDDADWIHVQIGAQTGYMHSDYVSFANAPAAQSKTARIANPNADWVNVRNRPSMHGDVIGQCENGETVWLLGETASGWSYVYADAQYGYMDSDLLKAAAQIAQDQTPVVLEGTTEIVGRTTQGDYIHRYTAENGEQIFFSSIDVRPRIRQEDVNFDGIDDLVAIVSSGASNMMCEFFVFTQEGYAYAGHSGISYGLANYTLHPGSGYVVSDANNGFAGALFETCIFRWEGNQLKLVRRAVSDQAVETAFSPGRYTETIYQDRLRIVIRDYQAGEYEGTVMYERELDVEDMDAAMYEAVQQEIWRGLKK